LAVTLHQNQEMTKISILVIMLNMPTRNAAVPRKRSNKSVLSRNAARASDPSSDFINLRGGGVQPTSITATDAKNEFALALEMVLRGRPVVITKHDRPKAVLLSIEDFQALSRSAPTGLESLTAEFDAMLDAMQTRKAVEAMEAAFNAAPATLSRTAQRAARRRA
jgi:antitoxin Phd